MPCAPSGWAFAAVPAVVSVGPQLVTGQNTAEREPSGLTARSEKGRTTSSPIGWAISFTGSYSSIR